MNQVEQLLAVTHRLHRACLTVASVSHPGPKAFFSTWPAYKLDWWDAEDFGSQRTDEAVTRRLIQPPRFVPTAKEIDDALPALALLDGFDPARIRKARKLIGYRALQLWYGEHVDAADERFAHWRGGWRRIGALCRTSHTNAQNIHYAATVYALERQLRGEADRSTKVRA